jgi:heterodisulfide reductase subunit C
MWKRVFFPPLNAFKDRLENCITKGKRKLIQSLVNSENKFEPEENDLIWLCSTCYQCEDRCPEGIPLTTLLIN